MTQENRLDILKIARNVIDIEANSVKSCLEIIDITFLKIVEKILNTKGKVIVSGIGKSGLIGRKIAATLSSTGTPSLFIHASEALHGDIGTLQNTDIVLLISKSGNSDVLLQLIPVFKKIGVYIILFTGNSKAQLAENADIVLNIGVHKEACPLDLAPTSSSIATLALGDALAITLSTIKNFKAEDFALRHPGGTLGRRLLDRVKDHMLTSSENVPVVKSGSDMKNVIIEMTTKRGITSVIDEQGLVTGVITDGDLRRAINGKGDIFKLKPEDIMTSNPKITHPDELAISAVKKMEDNGITALIVISNDKRPTGIIHLHDLMRAGVI